MEICWWTNIVRNGFLWSNEVSNSNIWKAQFVRQGFFLRVFSCNFNDQLSPDFHRFVILCICWDTPSEKTWSFTTGVQCLYRRCFSYTSPNASKWLGYVSECNAIIFLHRAVLIWRHTFKQRFHWGKRGHIIGRQLLLVLENVPSSSVVIAVSQARWRKLWMRVVRRCLPAA